MWYSASLFFKSVHKQGVEASGLWEEKVFLFSAESEEQVRLLAAAVGKEEEVSYETVSAGLVEWKFDSVGNVCPLSNDRPGEGTEVFWRFLRASEVESILKPFD
jgi:hypothetical protein